MAEADVNVRNLPARLPEYVEIAQDPDIRLTPNQIRALKAETGRPLSELLNEDADDGDRFQTIAWLELRRQGINAHWDDVGDVAIRIRMDATPPDPTNDTP